MRFLLTSVGSRGDVQPLLGLAVGLRRAGHEVLLAVPRTFEEQCAQLGLPFRPFGLDFHELAQAHPDLARTPLNAVRIVSATMKKEIATQFATMDGLLEGVDHVVATSLQFAAASFAEKRGIGFTFAVFAPGLVRSSNHGPVLFPWQDVPKPINRVSWWIFHHLVQWTLVGSMNSNRASLGLPPKGRAELAFFSSEMILAADPELTDAPVNPAIPQVMTGAWTLSSDDVLPPDVEAFLAAGPAPYFLGFGSVPDANAAASTQAFVDSVRAVGGRGIVSRGWAGLGAEPLPEGFIAVGSLPHEKVFPRVAAVIHHGGAGTTQTVTRAGVPHVVVPHGADQFYWAHRVQRMGLGPRGMPKAKFSAALLTPALKAIASDYSYRERALAYADRLRSVNGVANTIEYLERNINSRI